MDLSESKSHKDTKKIEKGKSQKAEISLKLLQLCMFQSSSDEPKIFDFLSAEYTKGKLSRASFNGVPRGRNPDGENLYCVGKFCVVVNEGWTLSDC